jgi:transposase
MEDKAMSDQKNEFAALVGWDWADQSHEVRLVTASGEIERSTIAQSPNGLHEWVQKQRERFEGRKVGIAIEQTRGPVVYALMAYDFLVLYPINPKSLARFREALRPSKAKDDPSDAELLLELISKHRDKLKAWKPDDERSRELRMLVEYRRDAVNERTRHTNKLVSLLKLYFPQALQWAGDLNESHACDFLETWANLEQLKGADRDDLRRYFSKQGRKLKTIKKLLQEIDEARTLTTDGAVLRSAGMAVQMSVRQVRQLNESIKEFDKRIEELFASHPDHDLFNSFPGAGKVLAPRLSAVMGTDRARYTSPEEVQEFSGVAPVTEQSGKSKRTHRRYACPRFVHQTFVEYARQTIIQSPWAQAYYQACRRRGQGHNAALRSLAFKWIRIIYRCWKDRVLYDEQAYEATLARRGSPIALELNRPANLVVVD